MARDRAARFTELVEQLRESLLIHGQDIARPLRRPHAMPTELALS